MSLGGASPCCQCEWTGTRRKVKQQFILSLGDKAMKQMVASRTKRAPGRQAAVACLLEQCVL